MAIFLGGRRIYLIKGLFGSYHGGVTPCYACLGLENREDPGSPAVEFPLRVITGSSQYFEEH